MPPHVPTDSWFDRQPTNTKEIYPDGSVSHYYLTVGEFHRRAIQYNRDVQRHANRRQIEVHRRTNELRRRLNTVIESYGDNRPQRNAGESTLEYLHRLSGGTFDVNPYLENL